MKALEAVLTDQPIAYHPLLAKVCKSVTTAVYLSQLLYWTPRARDPGGWFYKTEAALSEETGLTRRNQETGRSRLSELKILQVTRRGVPATLYYKLDLERLAELIDQCANRATSSAEPSELDCLKRTDLSTGTRTTSSAEPSELLIGNREYTETTTEITAEKGLPLDKPAYFSTLEEFGTIRRLKRKGKGRMIEYASSFADQLDLQVEADKFFDFHVARSRDGPNNPVLAWRNWLDKAIDFATVRRRGANGNRVDTNHGKPRGHPQTDREAAADLERRQQQMANERGVRVGSHEPQLPQVP